MVIAGKAKSKSKKKRRALCIGRAFKGGTGNNKKGKKARRIAPANVAPVPEEPLGGVGDANLPVKKRRRAEEPTARATRGVQEPTLNCKPRGPAAAKPKKVPVSALSPGSQEQRRKRNERARDAERVRRRRHARRDTGPSRGTYMAVWDWEGRRGGARAGGRARVSLE